MDSKISIIYYNSTCVCGKLRSCCIDVGRFLKSTVFYSLLPARKEYAVLRARWVKKSVVLLILIVGILGFSVLFSSKPSVDLQYVQNLDLNRYVGSWYAVKEIPSYLGVYPFGYD